MSISGGDGRQQNNSSNPSTEPIGPEVSPDVIFIRRSPKNPYLKLEARVKELENKYTQLIDSHKQLIDSHKQLMDNYTDILDKYNKLYYAPKMPGSCEAENDFDKLQSQ